MSIKCYQKLCETDDFNVIIRLCTFNGNFFNEFICCKFLEMS